MGGHNKVVGNSRKHIICSFATQTQYRYLCKSCRWYLYSTMYRSTSTGSTINSFVKRYPELDSTTCTRTLVNAAISNQATLPIDGTLKFYFLSYEKISGWLRRSNSNNIINHESLFIGCLWREKIAHQWTACQSKFRNKMIKYDVLWFLHFAVIHACFMILVK